MLVERLIRVMSQAAQPGNPHTHTHLCNPFIDMYSIHPYCTNIVCLCRKQSTSGHPGAKLSFIEAVCAVGRPLYNQRRPPSMSGGMEASLILEQSLSNDVSLGGFSSEIRQKKGGQWFKNWRFLKKKIFSRSMTPCCYESVSYTACLGILHFPLISWYFRTYLKPLNMLKVDSLVVMTISSLKNTNHLSETKIV